MKASGFVNVSGMDNRMLNGFGFKSNSCYIVYIVNRVVFVAREF